jgi:hypothetical protein
LLICLRNHFTTIMKSFLCATFLLFWAINSTFAQTKSEAVVQWRGAIIPAALREPLKNRLDEFVSAVRKGQWNKVNELLGDFRGRSGGLKYSVKHKQCLIDSIKASPLISFKYNKTSQLMGTRNEPLGKQWWNIEGTGEFKTESGIVSKEITISAYRNKSNWFFTPGFYFNRWNLDKVMQTAEEDFVKYIEVLQSPDSMVEIQNVSVKSGARFPERLLTFDVFNKSTKTISGLNYKVMGNFFIPPNGIKEIKPNEKATFETKISPGATFCEGEIKRQFFIDTVWFTDKTEWNLKQPDNRR